MKGAAVELLHRLPGHAFGFTLFSRTPWAREGLLLRSESRFCFSLPVHPTRYAGHWACLEEYVLRNSGNSIACNLHLPNTSDPLALFS
eukprot:5182971-Pyramimonas_sp.AAC.1